ncbi:MAG: chemotaxis protein CheW [Phycisphaera sp. RhM]|nr:chemotaxis protein CheW [Phycisphaera sp. RhM]
MSARGSRSRDATKRAKPNTASQRLVIFKVAGQRYGIDSSVVTRVIAMPQLDQLPEAPTFIFGFLNLSGSPLPVIRLDRLLHQSESALRRWTPLMLVHLCEMPLALLVDEVTSIVSVAHEDTMTLPPGHVFNDCVDRIVRHADESILVLSPDRLFLERELQMLNEQRSIAEERAAQLDSIES